MSPRCYSAITGSQQKHSPRQLCKQEERPAPPDLPSQSDNSIRAAWGASIGKQQPHFGKRRIRVEVQPFPHPRFLQPRQPKSPLVQHWSNAPRPTLAERTLPVIKNPATRVVGIPVSGFGFPSAFGFQPSDFPIVCCFSIHRSLFANKKMHTNVSQYN
jgi:hypothetical protein